MAGSTINAADVSNALAFAQQKVRETGVDLDAYLAVTTPYDGGWWFRFDRQLSAGSIGKLDHIVVRVPRNGEAELFKDRK